MKQEIVYFERQGEENTDETVRLAVKRENNLCQSLLNRNTAYYRLHYSKAAIKEAEDLIVKDEIGVDADKRAVFAKLYQPIRIFLMPAKSLNWNFLNCQRRNLSAYITVMCLRLLKTILYQICLQSSYFMDDNESVMLSDEDYSDEE